MSAGAVRRDQVISIVSLVVMSVPEFMVATVLVLLFAIGLPVFPAVVLRGSDATVGELLPTIWLPIIVLTLAMAAYIVRTARSSTIDVMASEFVTTAELKGLTMRRVVWKHAVPSALLPTLNVVALNVAWLLGGVVVVENVFNYPGMGKLMLESVFNRDLPDDRGDRAARAPSIYVVCNLAADLVALALDPRLRTRQRRPRTRTRSAPQHQEGRRMTATAPRRRVGRDVLAGALAPLRGLDGAEHRPRPHRPARRPRRCSRRSSPGTTRSPRTPATCSPVRRGRTGSAPTSTAATCSPAP